MYTTAHVSFERKTGYYPTECRTFRTGEIFSTGQKLLTRFVYYEARRYRPSDTQRATTDVERPNERERERDGVYSRLIEKPCPETTFLCASTTQLRCAFVYLFDWAS